MLSVDGGRKSHRYDADAGVVATHPLDRRECAGVEHVNVEVVLGLLGETRRRRMLQLSARVIVRCDGFVDNDLPPSIGVIHSLHLFLRSLISVGVDVSFESYSSRQYQPPHPHLPHRRHKSDASAKKDDLSDWFNMCC